MNDRPTPETDASRGYALSSHYGRLEGSYLQMDRGGPFVHAEVACKLERERDEARKELEEYRSIAENIGAVKAVSEKEKAICERNESLEELKPLRTTTPETDDFELNLGDYSNPWKAIEFARKLERERDEAREEQDKAKTELEMWRDGNILHEIHRNELEKAERERDEAREEAAHWKSEWEIVEARLCGWKHPRDNGITFEHEVIPVLMKERDEAREYSKATWQSLRDSQDEVLRLTFENRELRRKQND